MSNTNNVKPATGIGFIILAAAAVVGVISIVLYGSAMNKSTNAYIFMAAAVAVAVISLIIGKMNGAGISNWGGAFAAMLMAAGLAWSLTVMVDAIGYVISGLYQFSLLQTYITFTICAGISWLLFVISGFAGVVKK